MARASINVSALRWAREAVSLGRDELARAADIDEDRLIEFETGIFRPTLRQLENIAIVLDRTPAFFLINPPRESDVPEIPDFRTHRKPVPSLLAKEMRQVEQRRDTMLELEGRPARPALVEAIDWHNITARAREMQHLLGLTAASLPPEGQGDQVLGLWRDLLERNGYLVFQVAGIGPAIFRGLSIYHDVLPIILLNSEDSSYGKVFTLFHEVAHVANRTGGICGLDDGVRKEAIANVFAASVLMPGNRVDEIVSSTGGTAIKQANTVAKTFKVSSFAAGIRLRTLDLISDEDLQSIGADDNGSVTSVHNFYKKHDRINVSWQTRCKELGSRYVGAVARALKHKRIDVLDASYLLNIRIPAVRRMLDDYYRTGGRQ